MAKVVLVGSPNVGKSVIFNYLTGQYVTVSNYPGTTVDIARGHCKINGKIYEVIDTPGIYSLISITEEERVTRQLLCQEKADIIIHVIDGKNIHRMLPLTLQLIEAGFPIILIINLMDEAKDCGIFINTVLLAKMLGITVIGTSAIKKIGLGNLKQAIGQYRRPAVPFHMEFSNEIEQSIHHIVGQLTVDYGVSPRMAALLLLQGDDVVHTLACKEPFLSEILAEIKGVAVCYEHNMEYVLAVERQTTVNNICDTILGYGGTCQRGFMEKLGQITREPLSGIPILCLVLFLGLYEFVGKFGAGFLVDYIDTAVFTRYINPVVEHAIYQHIPWEWLQSLIVGKYGIFSLGFRYAFVIILPIVGTFFLMFAILEDSGYLPRLAMLVDKVFKYLGLNGRAVIPFALGLGCGTMAVMVTRTLETRRERILATFLLSLTIPCSAQLGVILALLSHSTLALTIWAVYIGIIFAVVGWLSGKIIPGESSAFYMEIPPLRLPLMSNVLSKACVRMWWYFVEILPVFIITSLIIWSADRWGLLIYIIKCVEPAMTLLGLPEEAAQAFLLGFFRRDYGAAGLYDMCTTNGLTTKQLLIASVTLTLFMPCIAQVAVMIKERGLLLSAIMILIIVCMAFFSGWLLYWLLDYWQIVIS
ncbi:MAG: ferrous iron transport protein B [Sporomusaceae bacterium]|nr:ferrous iron transport protein B [Sporomusaceae bacterium]